MTTPYYQDSAVTIFLGDCREILPSLPKVDLVLTDPPYGVGVNYGENYDDKRIDYWDWMRETIWFLRNIDTPLVFTHRVSALRELTGWDWIAVWNKPGSFGSRLGNSPVLPHWEPIFLYGIHSLGTTSGGCLPDVISINPEKAMAGNNGVGREKWIGDRSGKHPCPKPESLMRILIRPLTMANETILDPFMGSGTTLRAAKDLGRKAIGIEIEEKYCEIAARRMEQEVFDFQPQKESVAVHAELAL